ncbi:MAG TPA: rRNA maturation RNase YbeY [Bryobacteraceae bacterium]|nr:rRNA maturation RNase YbeY [Bryobacteraceae bacterium]
MSRSEPMVLIRRTSSGLQRGPLEVFARQLRERVTGGRWFQCLITGDRELQRLNRQFLGKNYPTDVLSFPAAENAGTFAGLGEVAVSYQRAREQARALGHSVDDEIRILMLHGALHLMGMDHERDRGAMARAEIGWRHKLGLPASLIERASA